MIPNFDPKPYLSFSVLSITLHGKVGRSTLHLSILGTATLTRSPI